MTSTLHTDRSAALYEPVRGEFNTQHSTTRSQQVALDGLILLTEVGSTMHGVTQPNVQVEKGSSNEGLGGDDVDEMGVCIEHPDYVTGLSRFEQYEYRTQPVNVRSGPGDIDRVVYGLRKYASLAAAGNPTVLMPLFAGQSHLRYIDPYGEAIRDGRGAFLSKQAGRKFLGYLDGQRKRYLDPTRNDSKHVSRPELVEAYGWDTKTGYHALRLAIQGSQLMATGHIYLPMVDGDREFLLNVRNGKHSKEYVTELLDTHYIPNLKRDTENSTLPERPDYDRINSWLNRTYAQFWAEKGWF